MSGGRLSRPRKRLEDFDFDKAPRELLVELARQSFVYWHTPGPGPKPVATAVVRSLDELLDASRRLRTRAVIDAEIADLCRDRSAMPRPFDLDEAAQINRRIEELCREPSAEGGPSSPAQACGECEALRGRVANIYHLTLTGKDAASTVQSVRAASAPGAPAPASGVGRYTFEDEDA